MYKITIRDIARVLGVSISTVSKALSDSHEIGDETKKRIVDYAKKYNYYPNRHAKNLKFGKTNTIGVIVCDVYNAFTLQVVASLQKNLIENGLDILLMQSHHCEANERECIEYMINKGVDGILISPLTETSNVDILEKLQPDCPIVLFDRIKSRLNTHKIGIDNVGATFKATQHLLRIGKKNIMILLPDLGIGELRLQGYKNALYQYNIPYSSDSTLNVSLKDTDKMDDAIKNFILKRLDLDNPPDAVICGSETISTRILGILREMDINVPKDISVIGFTNITFAFSLNPPLSSIVQPADDIGRVVAEKMVELLKNPSQDYKTIELETQLVIRESCGYFSKK